MSDQSIVSIQNLTKIYRQGWRRTKVKAVDDLSLNVQKGSVVGIIGPNGAGKSTTIYCMLGLLIPDSGSVQLFGQDPQFKSARRRLGFQSEIFHTYDYLKPKAALKLYGGLSGLSSAQMNSRIDAELERLGLMHARNRKVGSFSKGMKQRLGIAQALMHDPELLVLDEPFTGLDPQGRKEIGDIIFEERKKGTTVFFSSHILSDIERLCDEIIMIRRGEVELSGSLDEVTATEGQWCIRVNGWEQLDEAAIDRSSLTIREESGGTELICSRARKEELLRLLLDLPVDIVGVRQESQSLEDLYMKLENNASA